MKGQLRLDACMAKGLIKQDTRFLYRDHGAATGPLLEGTLREIAVDNEDGDTTYVRLDGSGKWANPIQLFVEFIFPGAAAQEGPVILPPAAAHGTDPAYTVPSVSTPPTRIPVETRPEPTVEVPLKQSPSTPWKKGKKV